MISGMYLGELVRIVCMDLVDKKLLFKGQVSEKFRTKDSFPAEFVSWVERYLTRGPVIIYYWPPLPPSLVDMNHDWSPRAEQTIRAL